MRGGRDGGVESRRERVAAARGTVLTHPDAAEKVRERVPRHVDVVGVEQPELARADGALTCGVVVLDPFFSWRTFS